MRHFSEQTKWLPVEEIREKNVLKRNEYFDFDRIRILCITREEAINTGEIVCGHKRSTATA